MVGGLPRRGGIWYDPIEVKEVWSGGFPDGVGSGAVVLSTCSCATWSGRVSTPTPVYRVASKFFFFVPTSDGLRPYQRTEKVTKVQTPPLFRSRCLVVPDDKEVVRDTWFVCAPGSPQALNGPPVHPFDPVSGARPQGVGVRSSVLSTFGDRLYVVFIR